MLCYNRRHFIKHKVCNKDERKNPYKYTIQFSRQDFRLNVLFNCDNLLKDIPPCINFKGL